MEKKYWVIILCLVTNYIFAQIGVNQRDPKSTLDIVARPLDSTKFDGILSPRITLEQLNKKVNYTTAHKGLLLYITDVSLSVTPRPTRFEEVSTPGYYVFNGEVWLAMESKIGSVYFSGSFNNQANPNNNLLIPNNTFSAVPFSTNEIKINKGGGQWTVNKYKIPITGAYFIKANLETKTNTSPTRDIYISVEKFSNPPSIPVITPFGLWKVSTLGNFTMDFSKIAYFNKNEEIALYIHSNSTTDLEISFVKLDVFIISAD